MSQIHPRRHSECATFTSIRVLKRHIRRAQIIEIQFGAAMNQGVLTLTLPKSEIVKPSKIAISE